MKLNIAICDDNINHLNVIEGYLQEFNSSIDIHIIKVYSGEELLDMISDYSIDIAFLDIEMKELNGIEVGREIRAKFPEAVIVFITGYRDYALEAFEIESFQYIIKPITCEKFYSVVEKIILGLREKITYEEKKSFFTMKTKEQIIKIRYDDIYSFERQGKKIIIETSQGSLEFLDSLKNITEEIKVGNFLRCHHGFIVNADKIMNFKENFIAFDKINKKIPVSRRYKQEVLNTLSKNLFSD